MRCNHIITYVYILKLKCALYFILEDSHVIKLRNDLTGEQRVDITLQILADVNEI